MQFNEFLEFQGVGNPNQLTGFLIDFLKDPSILFELSEKDRDSTEKQIDHALLAFGITSHLNNI
jgi:hypothetical protein